MRIAICTKRIYDPVDSEDGARVLVDRIWPRGVAKKTAALRLWLKDVAPSAELRQWFGHKPGRWDEFCRRYRRELNAQGAAIRRLVETAKHERLTLLFAARDRLRNNAVALADYLSDHAAKKGFAIAEPSSPVCFASEAEPLYFGMADRDELVIFVNELLEAERAFAKVTVRMCEGTRNAALKAFFTALHHNEAKWQAMLLSVLRRLRAKPSEATGLLYEEVMAVGDVPGRLAILNRGQECVVRKLRKMLPKIQDDGIRAELAEMLAAHERNIRLVDEHGSAKQSTAEKNSSSR